MGSFHCCCIQHKRKEPKKKRRRSFHKTIVHFTTLGLDEKKTTLPPSDRNDVANGSCSVKCLHVLFFFYHFLTLAQADIFIAGPPPPNVLATYWRVHTSAHNIVGGQLFHPGNCDSSREAFSVFFCFPLLQHLKGLLLPVKLVAR